MITHGETEAGITAAAWRKSSHSGSGNNCVEVAQITGAVAVRDSRHPTGSHLTFAPGAWAAFVADIKRGSYPR